MGGLLLKDCYVLGKQLKIFLVVLVLFAVVPNASWCAFAIMYASMMPITTLGYDERAKWGKLAAMMPYSSGQIVMSKYLLGYISIAIVVLLSLAAQSVYGIVKGTGMETETIVTIITISIVALLLLAINLPLMFKMGVEKGRLFFLVLTVGVVIGSVSLLDGNIEVPNITTMIIGLAIAVIILNIVSIGISRKLYKV